MKNKSLKIILTAVAILLVIPFIAMQFTDEVSWTIFDFIIMGALLLSTGFLCELTIRKVSKTKYRIILCIVILAAFLIIWAELAVGILGTPFAGR
jgi:dipeptide/tripeptide permease